jgi:hypothetical protein
MRSTTRMLVTQYARQTAGRIRSPLDTGELAAFLLSHVARFISGQNVTSDGGMKQKIIYRKQELCGWPEQALFQARTQSGRSRPTRSSKGHSSPNTG